MPSRSAFDAELQNQIDRARKQGRPHVEVNAGELHRVVGDYPGTSHSMPSCCDVMRTEYRRGNAELIFEPEKGNGASLTIRYLLPR